MSREQEYEIQYLLRLIGLNTMTFVNQHLQQYDLTNQQGWILRFLDKQEQEGQTVCQRDIEDVLDITSSSVTSLLQGLERKQFIVRRSSASDARVKELFITDKGRALIADFVGIFQQVEDLLVKGLTGDERRMLVGLLQRVANNIG
ncbi:winged helix DNA-binding protein [Chloroflexia bacterium SDU3-3]|nr:winged helix DNA-binding protein [Chloroflexia bacterium SDU3-3]